VGGFADRLSSGRNCRHREVAHPPAVAAATSMKREDESLLFRFTFKHSVFLASMIGLVVMFYAYAALSWAP
jgi:L-lactate permease